MGGGSGGVAGADSSRAAGTMHSEHLKEPLVQLGGETQSERNRRMSFTTAARAASHASQAVDKSRP